MKPINVVSLFDGMSCGQIALEREKIPVKRYLACEIDKYAMQITQKNYPNTYQMGSVTDFSVKKLGIIDLLIGGSPCQGFSFAGKQLNFDDPRSKLFFEYVRILKECKPKYFLLENVKMKKEFQDIISGYLGIEPIEINSNLVSAQNRKRLYWTNIPGVCQPKDKDVLLKDIVHEYCDDDFKLSEWLHTTKALKYMDRADKNGKTKWDHAHHSNSCLEKSKCITANTYKGIPYNVLYVPFDKTLQILDKEIQRGKIGYFRKDSQSSRVYHIHGKAITLCGDAGGGAAKMGQYLFGCVGPDIVNKNQNGQRFNTGKKFYTLTSRDRHGILIEGYIRKLTPIECERLQTVPDNYTEGVSNSQRYKMCGNGWTVDAIAHIFRGMEF
jgi:DNA (cytosine-5)-methyltransferase 3A